MSSVLYDTPGRRTRRRILIGSVAAGTAMAGLVALVLVRLADSGQLDSDKWRPIFDPTTEEFPTLWRFLAGGMLNTLKAAAWAMLFSLVIGTLLAAARITATKWWRWLIIPVTEVARGVPVVMAIFFASRVLPEVGIHLPVLWYLVIGLTAYNSVVIAEILRAGVQALPRGQTEAAQAIGLTRRTTLRLILLPQAFRIMLPALISQLVVVLKDTSLGAFISYDELLRRGKIAVQNLHNPFQVYLVVGAIFIVVNYILSRIATHVERRASRNGASGESEAKPTIPAVEPQPMVVVGA